MPYFTPLWAIAAAPHGCQKARNRHARAQMPRIAAYRRLLRAFNGLADKVGVKIDFISPWNEPNHPAFLQPQRARCVPTSKATSPQAYARLVRARRQELRPGQQIVLGSLAGLQHKRVFGASALEFIRGLPRDVACLDVPFAQHAYVGVRPPVGGRPRPASLTSAARYDLLDTVIGALDAHNCGHTSRCGSPRPARLTIAATRCRPRCARGRSTTASTRPFSTRSGSHATTRSGS